LFPVLSMCERLRLYWLWFLLIFEANSSVHCILDFRTVWTCKFLQSDLILKNIYHQLWINQLSSKLYPLGSFLLALQIGNCDLNLKENEGRLSCCWTVKLKNMDTKCNTYLCSDVIVLSCDIETNLCLTPLSWCTYLTTSFLFVLVRDDGEFRLYSELEPMA